VVLVRSTDPTFFVARCLAMGREATLFVIALEKTVGRILRPRRSGRKPPLFKPTLFRSPPRNQSNSEPIMAYHPQHSVLALPVAGTLRVVSLIVVVVGAVHMAAGNEPEKVRLRFVAYNVEFGKNATADEIGKMLKPWKPDVVCFSEVPGGIWTADVGKVLGMEHVQLGKISSANHKDKYKSILSRTSLVDPREFELKGKGWNPASAVRAVTVVGGHRIAIYSLHVSSGVKDPQHSHSQDLATRVLAAEKEPHVVVMGDFNDLIDSRVMTLYQAAGFSNLWSALGINVKSQFTWNAFGAGNEGVIDHLLFNRPETTGVIAGGILELTKPLSDHKPIWAELEFRGGEGKRGGTE
jgi:endonuclease/exonuclease/phosphatase family metal-dependent hydrolase